MRSGRVMRWVGVWVTLSLGAVGSAQEMHPPLIDLDITDLKLPLEGAQPENPHLIEMGLDVGGRSTHVRVSSDRELGIGEPLIWPWQFYPPFEAAPPSPAQDSIRLTDRDPLTIVVPMFAYRPMLGRFDARFVRQTDHLELDGFLMLSGGMTETIYGPHEYLHPISALPQGSYALTVRLYQIWDWDFTSEDFDVFRSDPVAYALGQGLQLDILQQHLSFAVVPEPAALGLVVASTLVAVGRRR